MKLSIVIVWPCQTTQSRTSSQTPVEMRPLVFAFAAHGATGELGARASCAFALPCGFVASAAVSGRETGTSWAATTGSGRTLARLRLGQEERCASIEDRNPSDRIAVEVARRKL